MYCSRYVVIRLSALIVLFGMDVISVLQQVHGH